VTIQLVSAAPQQVRSELRRPRLPPLVVATGAAGSRRIRTVRQMLQRNQGELQRDEGTWTTKRWGIPWCCNTPETPRHSRDVGTWLAKQVLSQLSYVPTISLLMPGLPRSRRSCRAGRGRPPLIEVGERAGKPVVDALGRSPVR
jgi:hypothetical protein